MNFLDLMSFIGEGNSLSIENCKVQLTVQQNEGGLELNIDFFTADQKNYDQTQKFLADRGVDWLEHFYKPVGATISHIEVKTKLNLFLFHGMEEQLQNHI